MFYGQHRKRGRNTHTNGIDNTNPPPLVWSVGRSRRAIAPFKPVTDMSLLYGPNFTRIEMSPNRVYHPEEIEATMRRVTARPRSPALIVRLFLQIGSRRIQLQEGDYPLAARVACAWHRDLADLHTDPDECDPSSTESDDDDDDDDEDHPIE